MVSASDDGIIRIWNTSSGALCRLLAGHEGRVYCVKFSTDNKTIVSGGSDGTGLNFQYASAIRYFTHFSLFSSYLVSESRRTDVHNRSAQRRTLGLGHVR